jgi:hypothetical protein
MRNGWLLWQDSLRQFLYFEEPLIAPKPSQFTAMWVERHSGARKGARNLWIYEKRTGKKRFSVTADRGPKDSTIF